MHRCRISALGLFLVSAINCMSCACYAQFDIEEAPFEYSKTQDDNLVSKLARQIKSGEKSLNGDRQLGFLRRLLKELDIDVSSQGLVFSKTSLQVRYISTKNPRAIYFNDDVYVGWVRGSSMLEISTTDAKLGAAFYSAEPTGDLLKIRRRNYTCLGCHATSMTQGIPGHTVRSVFPNTGGGFDIRRKSYVTDHRSPLAERWGGWFVTGLHGDMKHMGNSTLSGSQLNTTGNANLANLRDRIFTLDWPSPYSDIVALMVLEHQTQMHNTFTLNNFAVRRARYDAEQKIHGSPADRARELERMVADAAKNIVEYMLFLGESPLTAEIKPSSRFTKYFSERGPNCNEGRSLRTFNLQTRLFEYPCSYLIYSQAFDDLEPALRDQVYHQLWELLNRDESADEFNHLTNKLRAAIRDIIRDTKDDLPTCWSVKRG